MMKRTFILPVIMIMVLALSVSAHAALELRGTDSIGNRLIYDTDLNITWYDYTKSQSTWQNQINWASSLSVSGGDLVGVYQDWRLPSTVDGLYVVGYDGTTTAGYNITSSEMGHLFYTELGNKGVYATDGSSRPDYGLPYGLTNTGYFQNLISDYYWSGTEYTANAVLAWGFNTQVGSQSYYLKNFSGDIYAIAVRDGDVAVVPEPVSMVLFGAGAVVMGVHRMVRKRRG